MMMKQNLKLILHNFVLFIKNGIYAIYLRNCDKDLCNAPLNFQIIS